jgi:hypothetical protein
VQVWQFRKNTRVSKTRGRPIIPPFTRRGAETDVGLAENSGQRVYAAFATGNDIHILSCTAKLIVLYPSIQVVKYNSVITLCNVLSYQSRPILVPSPNSAEDEVA